MAGDDARLGIDVQGIADDAAPVRVARKRGDLAVGRDFAARDLSDNVVNQFKGVFHSVHRFHRDGISIDSGSGFIPAQSALFYHGSAVIASLRLDRIPLSEVEYR